MCLQDEQCDECPLCMEPFEMDDFNFFPCICGYQICRFCWHRIRTDENGLCPACRQQYAEDPADFKPLTADEWQKIKNEKRQKDQQKKQKLSENRKHLANVRVVQKNLVFVVGLPTRLADPEVLKKHDYFGKFGKIHKVVVNQSTSYAGSQGPSASAYVTYCKAEDALRAIKTVNNIQVDSRTLKASLGTTKYCSHFLKNQLCPKTDCMYLHELGDEAASFTKEDMQQGKHQEYEKKLQDQILGCNNTNNNRKQTASPTPPQNTTPSNKDSWSCTVQNVKESRTSRSKDVPQSQRTDGKSSRSKTKHTSEGQKSKKSKSKSSDSAQHSKQSTKEDGVPSKRSQKGKQKESASVASPVQRLDTDRDPSLDGSLSDIRDMSEPQTTFVHIAEQQPSKPVSANIKIGRSESPVLPPSPISSSSSSLFTPFGSLSSNFLSSSSPSPPPSGGNPLSSFGAPAREESSPVNAFIPPPAQQHPLVEHKQQPQQSPCSVFNAPDNSDSLFSHMNYHHTPSIDSSLFNGHLFNEETCTPDNSDWISNCTYEDPQKPEDDLDFDPWNESSKGLADLIAKEAVHNIFPNELPTPPGFFQPIKPPVPNQSRISVPPPGFCRPVPQTNALNHIPSVFHPPNTEFLQHCNKVTPARQTLNGCSNYFHQQEQQQQHHHPQHQQNPIDIANQFKPHYSQVNPRDNIIENLRMKKNWDERVRNLLPDMYYHLNSRNLQKSQSQNGLTWNHHAAAWLGNESPLNMSENQRSNAFLMKALQTLSLEENTNQFNGHTAYGNTIPLRSQWPTSQCPPPGFVAPSRSPVNTPFQHMQVNQKI